MGRQLGMVVKNYNEFGKTLEGNLSSRARRLSERYIEVGSKELTSVEFVEEEPRFADSEGIEIGKREIEDVPLVEAAPRHGDTRDIVEPGEALLIGEAASEAVLDTG